MTAFRSLNNNTGKRVLDLLEAGGWSEGSSVGGQICLLGVNLNSPDKSSTDNKVPEERGRRWRRLHRAAYLLWNITSYLLNAAKTPHRSGFR